MKTPLRGGQHQPRRIFHFGAGHVPGRESPAVDHLVEQYLDAPMAGIGRYPREGTGNRGARSFEALHEMSGVVHQQARDAHRAIFPPGLQ